MAEIQQVHTARLTWNCTNNRKETIFKPLDRDISHITLKPSSPIPILKHILYYKAVDQYATDSWLIIHRQSSDIPPTIDTPRIHQVLVGILVICQPTYQWTCWPTCCRVSADMSTDMSADTLAAISVKCRPTYWSTCRPIVDQYGDQESTDTRPTHRPTYWPMVPTDTQSRGSQITQDPT